MATDGGYRAGTRSREDRDHGGGGGTFRAFSDISIEVKNAIEAGGLEIAEVVLSATNDGPLDLGVGEVPPTGRRIHVPMVWSLDLNEDEHVIEERDYFDTAHVIEQLGLDQP